MNKYIKRKKKTLLKINKSLTKEERLFVKQFPRLYAICIIDELKLNRIILNKIYKRVINSKYSIDKDYFQTTLRMVLIHIFEDKRFKIGSVAEYYFELYTKLGIMFKDNEGNIKLKCI